MQCNGKEGDTIQLRPGDKRPAAADCETDGGRERMGYHGHRAYLEQLQYVTVWKASMANKQVALIGRIGRRMQEMLHLYGQGGREAVAVFRLLYQEHED